MPEIRNRCTRREGRRVSDKEIKGIATKIESWSEGGGGLGRGGAGLNY